MESDELVVLLTCGLVVRLIGEFALTLGKLFVCFMVVPCEHLQHCIKVVLVFSPWLLGFLLQFPIRFFIVLFGCFGCRVNVDGLGWYTACELELECVLRVYI